LSSITVGLVGNPNCGKTTVFNALTGARQRVGNWPGVTVERKTGFLKWQRTTIKVVDLPGTYSLTAVSDTASIDERIACEYVLNRHANVIVNIIDASHLERHLYLTMQLIEMRVPVIVALNMMDITRQQNKQISLSKLEDILGCPVVALEAHKGKGIKQLTQVIAQFGRQLSVSRKTFPYPAVLNTAIENLAHEIKIKNDISATWIATRLLEDDVLVRNLVSAEIQKKTADLQQSIRQELNEDADILFADSRYRFIEKIMAHCVKLQGVITDTWTARIDRIVLNRVLALPIFLGVMYCMFLFAINIGGALQDFFDIASNTLFVEGLAQGLAQLHCPAWLNALLTAGVGKGINTVITFIPVIGALFLFLAFLEDSGYMARAAFVMDRFMAALGLPGKAFVPMIIGFGCNVPAVMAARTLENKRDRILTVMMSPFMSCGARFAIYAVFTAAFFPVGGQNVIFMLYLTGILMAMLTGLTLRKTVLQGKSAPLILELPPYHRPHLKTLWLHAWQRLKNFVVRAGKLILPICVLLGMLNVLSVDGTLMTAQSDTHSLLSVVGRGLTPIFAPMGIHADNWPATVGLVSGVLAKEVVVGTLNSLYSQMGHLSVLANHFDFWGGLNDAVLSIPANFSALGQAFSNPLVAAAPVHTVSESVYGVMYQHFDGRIGAIAYLLFVLLYFPCVSTTAAMVRELGRGWAWFSVLWTTGIAYGTAVSFYQLATFVRHPWSSLGWIIGIALTVFITVLGLRAAAEQADKTGRLYEFARN
jgi:ferrous iron transport protein B